MNSREISAVLKTFSVVVDRREHRTPAAARRYESFGVPYTEGTLDYGDYCANVTLPSGPLIDVSTRAAPVAAVERKMSLDELAACFTSGRDRFRREFDRARENHAKIYLLVEGGSWEGIRAHRYRSRMNPKAFEASLMAWCVRYDAQVIFCRAELSGHFIKEFLYRDLKERLQDGRCG